MQRRNFIKWTSLAGAAGIVPVKRSLASGVTGIPSPVSDRAYWAALLEKIASPVLSNMSQGALRKNMPVEYSPTWDGRDKTVAYMEAFGRLIAGVGPWLALPGDDTPEGRVRARLKEQALKSLAAGVDPANPDCLNWHSLGQPLVDASYIAHAFIRTPAALWEPLDQTTKARYIASFKKLRQITPAYNNWLLFAAMIEVFLLSIGEAYDPMRVEVAVHKMDEWYAGDGWFSDGSRFHLDYYNSYVIQPMLTDILKVLMNKGKGTKAAYDLEVKRMQRYSSFLERFISPEGTYPPIGRSVTYRIGAFQPLGQLALNDGLPEEISPAQVRCALTAVMKRMFEQPGVFAPGDWLQLGFAGHQPDIADYYSNSGSMYLTSLGFLPLGLPADHTFWTSPFADWTQRKAWSGQPFRNDHAVDY
jgi:hypothetical protein